MSLDVNDNNLGILKLIYYDSLIKYTPLSNINPKAGRVIVKQHINNLHRKRERFILLVDISGHTAAS